MKPQRTIYLLVTILITTTSCLNGQSKAAMFEDQLQEYKVTQAYNEVQEAAAKDLQQWISDNLEEVELLKECTWKVDDAVFFNTKKDRCYLLLLIQDNAKEAEIDYVYQMYAALEDGKWKTYFSALPNYVYLRERLNLPKYTSVPMETLSRLARQEMLKGYYGSNRTIDDNFVDKTYTPFLKKRHVKFLNKKDN
jgi:hypothetical protein